MANHSRKRSHEDADHGSQSSRRATSAATTRVARQIIVDHLPPSEILSLTKLVEAILDGQATTDEEMPCNWEWITEQPLSQPKIPPTSPSNPNSVTPFKLSGGIYCYYWLKIGFRTPLQITVHDEELEMIRILLRYNADPNATFTGDDKIHRKLYERYKGDREFDLRRRTPLQEATMHGSKEIVELLLEHDADINSPHVRGPGATALQYSAMQGFL
ncbi:hypothetical protein V493_04269 [Pseudogymnoascus sp. VKM F-4281 (FW-2241)]|nr:hypothetical protein V493_04269 [Pseudogymnoascus sp. VKM F-4281 (FW-2241)]